MKNYQLNPVNLSTQTMKLVILFALVACAFAVPSGRNVVVSTPGKVVVVAETYNVPQQNDFAYFGQHNGNQFGSEGDNIYQVAQYIAYQFRYAQQQGYTGAKVSEYLIQQGFPEVVAEYLGKQYEAGESESYFQSPYKIFEYYYTQGVNEETLQYLAQQITKAFKLFHNFSTENRQKISEEELSGVPHIISQYVLEQSKYYNENAVTYPVAQYAYQQLQQAQQYAQNALHYFTNGQISQEAYRNLFEQLKQGIQYIHNIQMYQNYQQYYLPYYAAQYYSLQAQEAYQFFQNAYQLIQEYDQSVFPQSFVQQVQYAYFTARKAYQTFQQKQIVSSDSFGRQYEGQSGIYQYIQNLKQYIQLQLSQKNISEELASYIFQQLRFIQQYPYGSQYSVQQVQERFHNILHYVKQQKGILQFIEQYINQQVRYALQVLQHYNQGYQYYGQYYPKSESGFFQSLYQRYFDKNNQPSGYQYGPYQSQSYRNHYVYSGPYVSGYQYGRSYVPSGNLYGYQYDPSVYHLENVPSSNYYDYQYGPSYFQHASHPYHYQSGSYLPSATFQTSYPYQYSQVSSIPQAA
ncbi:myb-like protein Q [Euwallacea fornicatus]|uniref:myb-like protein Q n=1 Tax=Euwallacea fornicatus TaxID=995702 RepID=UPI00338E4B3B